MNIQTDLTVSPQSLNKSNWDSLCEVARKGSYQQREILVRWAYSEVPSSMYEKLCDLASLSVEYLEECEREANEPQWFSSEY